MIILECNNDELLIRSLGFSRKLIKHQNGKGGVFNWLNKNEKSIGIIDEDPNSTQPKDFVNYELLDNEHSIKLFRNLTKRETYLIQIPNYLEDWLIMTAKSNKIDLNKYNLPNTANRLHGLVRIDKRNNFINFIKYLVENDNECKIMKEWIIKHIH